MKNLFCCPHCDAVLNPSVKILLKVLYRKKQGMILLSPQPGNFKYICDKSIQDVLNDGATVTFFCPVCSAELTSPTNKKLAALNLVGPAGDERRVEFSRVYGTHATFIVDGAEVIAFGEDADDFSKTNFFGA